MYNLVNSTDMFLIYVKLICFPPLSWMGHPVEFYFFLKITRLQTEAFHRHVFTVFICSNETLFSNRLLCVLAQSLMRGHIPFRQVRNLLDAQMLKLFFFVLIHFSFLIRLTSHKKEEKRKSLVRLNGNFSTSMWILLLRCLRKYKLWQALRIRSLWESWAHIFTSPLVLKSLPVDTCLRKALV